MRQEGEGNGNRAGDLCRAFTHTYAHSPLQSNQRFLVESEFERGRNHGHY